MKAALLATLLAGTAMAAAAQAPQSCQQAWDEYNEFKKHNKMEPGRHAVTVYGANVRALCGADALPVPPGVDTPPRIIRRPPPPPPKPPQNPPAPK